MRNDMIKLAVDIAVGRVQNYSKQEANDALRKSFAEIGEFSLDGKIDRKTFRRHEVEIFEIIEETVNEVIHEGLTTQLQGFADYRNLAWGDTNLFQIPADQEFRVALISDGNANLRRQRLVDGQEFSVKLETYGIKVAEDFHRFLAGRVDWNVFIQTIAESFRRDLVQRIADAVMDSYGKAYGAPYHFTATSVPTEDEIVTTAMHIQARTGEKVNIYGTKLALRKLAPSNVTEAMNNDRNQIGYYGEIAGMSLYEIEQAHKFGTDDFAVDNNFIMLLPASTDKMIKVINEGDSIIQDTAANTSADMMKEYFIANRFGIALIATKAFGFIKFT